MIGKVIIAGNLRLFSH